MNATGRMKLLPLLASVCASLVLWAVGVSPAAAGVGHALGASFGEAGSGAGQLSLASFAQEPSPAAGSGLAVDGAGNLYVADSGNHRVDRFSSAHSFSLAFGGDVGGSGVNLCTITCAAGKSGSLPGEFVSPSFIAVDPVTSAVYVADTGDALISKWTTDGALIETWGNNGENGTANGQLNGPPGEPFTLIEGIAVDIEGNLRVYEHGGHMYEFAPDGTYIPGGSWSTLSGVRVDPGGLAVDGAGKFYFLSGFDSVFKAGPLGEELGWVTRPNTRGGKATALALGGFTDELYVDEGGRVEHFSSSCVPAGDLAGPFCAPVESFGSGAISSGVGISVDPSTNTVYVADLSGNRIITFPVAIEAETGPPSEAEPKDATLTGLVNPMGQAVTSCLFEYGTTRNYGKVAKCAEDSGQIGTGQSLVPVHARVEGLLDGQEYHFRLVASDANARAAGGDVSFATPPLPAIDAAAAEDLSSGSVDLTARIDPRGLSATFRMEYGVGVAYGHTVPVPDGVVGSGSGDVTVSEHVVGLAPDTEYHWRVVASNANGTAYGVDHTFVYDTEHGGLPDGRAYEMVTPPAKNGALIGYGVLTTPPHVGENGEDMIATSIQCFAGAQSCVGTRQEEGEPYLFSRTAEGWVTTPMAPSAAQFGTSTELAYSPNSGYALFSMPSPPGGQDDFYMRRPDGSFTNIGPASSPALGALGVSPFGGARILATGDLSHLVWQSGSPVWPFDGSASKAVDVYEYDGVGHSAPLLVGVSGGKGSTSLISECGTELDNVKANHSAYGPLSADGRVVYFIAEKCGTGTGSNEGVPVPALELYARVDESRTVHVNQRSETECSSTACEASAPKDAEFEGASADGSRVFFTSTQQLTDSATQDPNTGDSAANGCPSTAGGGGCNLYMFENAAAEDASQRHLVDVSAGDTSGLGPQVQGVVAISSDGSHVYFVARGVLSENTNDQGGTAVPGAENLYVYERDTAHPQGRTTFIAALLENGAADRDNWAGGVGQANVTPDGRFLVFESEAALTGDDTRPVGPAQVYRYDALTGLMLRVSIGEHGFNDNGNGGTQSASIVAASWSMVSTLGPARPDPTMSNDGEYIFFQSPVALTRGALNEVQVGIDRENAPVYAQNIYEWRAQGVTGCEQPEGCVALISDGRDTNVNNTLSAVELRGSDATGSNVFFTTADPLVPADTDTQRDFYDARICTAQSPCIKPPPLATPPCQGEGCHGDPAAIPPIPDIPSLTFEGQGNLVQPLVPAHAVKSKSRHKRKRTAHNRRHKRKGKAARHRRHAAKRRSK
ncbi:MAG: hypothetical protein ACRDK4_04110 [Solirubrobacteraceae bacterium]